MTFISTVSITLIICAGAAHLPTSISVQRLHLLRHQLDTVTISRSLPRVTTLSAVPPVPDMGGSPTAASIMPVAEPASITLLGIVLLGLCLWTRRKLN
ncbi:MAG: hypothetical protein DMG58_06660 [Acidobacteria bacterium]|nr:MAG: hypothetical protein DMG58_06660 [Acidobacteriota bacterium]